MSLLKRLGGGAPPPPPSEPAPKAAPPAPTPVAPPPQAAHPANAAPASAPAASPKVEDTGQPIDQKRMLELSLWCVDRIQASLGNQNELTRSPETEKLLQERFARVYQQAGAHLSGDQVKQLFTMVCDELMGFGPIQQLLNDDSISEVMVNGPYMIYVEQKGKLRLTDVRFANDEHVLKIIDRIIRPLGRRVDRKWPMVDARLPDGSRVNAIIPPCAIDGSTLTIRKFSKNKLKIDDLVRFGSMTAEMAEFLRACVVSRLNIVVAGGTGSGKTTLLNVLSNFIPDDERIVTIEDSAELQLGQDHVVRLESKPAEIDGSGRVQIRDLVINSLRMRPERVVIGECRGGETLDMLQAMNTGHDGSLTTLHANTPRDALARMETMTMMAGMDLPLKVIREQIASAIGIIVQQSRLDDGQRKVTYITEVQGMEGELVVLQDIFKLEIKGKSPEGKIICELKPTGVRPKFTPKLEAHGFKLPPSIFGAEIPGQKRGW
ncbi:MAG: CpaF family protein [Candidatus Viridilinea halotolerans]|uniref:CpaF family protein n=1 Tax=Candidatus Viridilinea halotolerans TaxID=2491704 RepID=A0A426U3Y8_9CHLR|nr:MAG: CpaF family protein [Candidatus Viridilinea halotolerans]